MIRNNDRGESHRQGARGARPLTGRLDYIRDQLTRIGVLIIEAARDADAQPHSRWVSAELVNLGTDVAELVSRSRELRAEMMEKGLSPYALGLPVPLVLNSDASKSKRLGRGEK